MPALRTVCIAVLLVVVLLFDKCFGYPSTRLKLGFRQSCESCGDLCNTCPAGIAISPVCGRVCAKRPGEICGGPGEMWGICGEGMYCNCNRCSGCSTTDLNCMQESGFKNICLPPVQSVIHALLNSHRASPPPNKS
ncbi:queen brain-selective protein-1 [Ptiloglossa arizonensis]|uniref:queen brain-selective protein-1 n=1 Tax=Ptiloglossa arizonensis TaxID=3350558 RepID=UPI003F9F202F